jgi:cytochrome c553
VQLRSFKRGERIQPLMQAALDKLGEKEFAALAAYYSQLQP